MVLSLVLSFTLVAAPAGEPLSSPSSTDASFTAAPSDVPLASAAPPTPVLPPPLSPVWAPLIAPASMLLPGVGHLARGDGRGWGMMAVATGSLTVGLGSALALGASGAADSISALTIPIALMSISTYLVLGSADAIGAFSEASTELPRGLLSESWNARARLGAGYVLSPDPVLRQAHYLQANGMIRLRQLMLEGRVMSDPRGGDVLLTAGASHRLVSFARKDSLPGEGLWIDGSVHREWNDRGRYNLTSLGLGARWEVPLLLFSPTWSRLSAQLRLGVRPLFGEFFSGGTTASTDLSGGYELRWSVTDWARPYWGYEHARDRFVGGEGIGFVGTFYAGAEFKLAEQLFLDVKGMLGTPDTLMSNLEWRW